MRSSPIRHLAALLAFATLACATSGRQLTWVRADGSPAPDAEIDTARDACIKEVDPEPGPGVQRYAHIEYAGKIVTCIETKGFKLVEKH